MTNPSGRRLISPTILLAKCLPWIVSVGLCGCGGGESTNEIEAPTDDLPVAHADLRALFEFLDQQSGDGYQCDHAFTLARQLLAIRKLPAESMIRWLGGNGAGCDCEVVFNVEPKWGERVGFVPKE